MNDLNQPFPVSWTIAELQALKEKFDQSVGTTFTGILLHKKVRILNADPALAAMFGYLPAELVDKAILELAAPESREVVLKNIFLNYQEPYAVIGLKKDGATFPLEIFDRVITYQGNAIKVMAVRDITSHEQAEVTAALQKAMTDLQEVSMTGSKTTQLRFSNEQLRLELDERLRMETALRDRARQQAAVAELGQRALVGASLVVLMNEAAALAAQTLGLEYVKFLELLPGGDHFLLRAGVGWQEGEVGRAKVSAKADSQAGYVLISGGPVMVEDLREETRFKPSPLLQEHQVVSGMSVIIYGPDAPFGVLGAHTTKPRVFTEDDIHFLQAVANVLAAAIENTRLQAETKKRAKQLAVLHELDRAITTSLRLTDIYYTFAQHAIRLLPYDHMAIMLLEQDNVRVTYVSDRDKAKPVLPLGIMLPLHGSAVGWVAAQGQPLARHNITTGVGFAEDERLIAGGILSSMIIPLRVKGQVIGVWHTGKQEIGVYSLDDLEIAQSMADQLAIAIENARLFQQARQEIAERQRAEAALQEERALLAQRVAERTVDLLAANEELARAARLKDEFLASMSHELRTPLTAILGMVELLQMEGYGPLTQKQQKSMLVIEESGRHLLDLINDILDLSKIEANKLELTIGPVPVEGACQSSLQFVKQAALNKDIIVSFTPDSAVSVLMVDERRFKQILVNLLSNAVKFTPERGQVGLEVAGDPARRMARFTVWDTGIGIAQADIARLFEPFVQLDSKLSRQYSGTGLGLALVNRMTKMHGGQVSVESKVGHGSRFTVSLPWDAPAPLVEAAGPVTPQDEGEAEDGLKSALQTGELNSAPLKTEPDVSTRPTPKPSALILLAEDESTMANLMSDYLQLQGYRVVMAQNGLQALELARQEKPDVVLMDIQMPELDGLETTRRLRAEAELAAIPVVALTALAMPGDRERCLEAGANSYLSKPVNLKQLLATIEGYLAGGGKE